MGLLGRSKGPIEALQEILGQRGYARKTFGTPARSRALALLYAFGKDFDDERFPELGKFLADTWAGEHGWDSNQSIQAIRAAAPHEAHEVEDDANDDE